MYLHLRNLLTHTLLFGVFLKTRIFNQNIFWNKVEQCFTVMYGYFQRKLTKTFEILKLELKTSKNESPKFTILQTNQYGKQNSNL